MYSSNNAHSRGFSLTELVAAMAIFSIGVMACVELYAVSLRSTSNSLDYTQAVFLARAVLEETMAEGILYASEDEGEFGERYPRHAWQRSIEETEQLELMQVRVIVTWQAQGIEKSYELVTLHADRDLTISGRDADAGFGGEAMQDQAQEESSEEEEQESNRDREAGEERP